MQCMANGKGFRKGFGLRGLWSSPSATLFGRRNLACLSISSTPTQSSDGERRCLGSGRGRHVVCTVEGGQRDRRDWRQLPTPSPQEVVLPSSFAACQARADAKVFPVPGGDRDPHDVNASSQDKSAGKYNASSQDESAGKFNASSQDKSAGKSDEKGRPS